MKEWLNAACDMCVCREKLINFTDEVTKEEPNFKFDYTYMDQFENPDTWFVEILCDQNLKDHIYNLA